MNANMIARLVKAAAALIAVAGVAITPEQVENIEVGFLAIYAIVSAFQAKLGK